MGPLPDRTALLAIAITLGLVFALVFWFARLNGQVETPFLWRESPALENPRPPTPQPKGTLL
jgi:hypothetical protein